MKYYTLPVKSTDSGPFPIRCARIRAGRKPCPTSPTSSRREFVKVAGSAALGASLFRADAFGPAPRQTPLRHRRHRRSRQRHVGPRPRPALSRTCSSSSASATSTRSARSPRGTTSASTLPDLHELRRDDRQGEARPADGDDRRRLPSRVHHQGARPRPRRDDREAADDRRNEVPGDSRRREAQQPEDRRHLQLPLRAGAPADEGDPAVRARSARSSRSTSAGTST